MVSFLNSSGHCCFFAETAVPGAFGSQHIHKVNGNQGEQENCGAYWIVKMEA